MKERDAMSNERTATESYWQDKKALMSRQDWNELMKLREEAYAACGKATPKLPTDNDEEVGA